MDNNGKKTSWFDGLKLEFKKIVWPTKKQLKKEAIAVVSASLVLGLIIAAVDYAIQFGMRILIG